MPPSTQVAFLGTPGLLRPNAESARFILDLPRRTIIQLSRRCKGDRKYRSRWSQPAASGRQSRMGTAVPNIEPVWTLQWFIGHRSARFASMSIFIRGSAKSAAVSVAAVLTLPGFSLNGQHGSILTLRQFTASRCGGEDRCVGLRKYGWAFCSACLIALARHRQRHHRS